MGQRTRPDAWKDAQHIGRQRNANEDHSDVGLHACQMADIKNWDNSRGSWGRGKARYTRWGCEVGQPFRRRVGQFLFKRYTCGSRSARKLLGALDPQKWQLPFTATSVQPKARTSSDVPLGGLFQPRWHAHIIEYHSAINGGQGELLIPGTIQVTLQRIMLSGKTNPQSHILVPFI